MTLRSLVAGTLAWSSLRFLPNATIPRRHRNSRSRRFESTAIHRIAQDSYAPDPSEGRTEC